MVLVTAARRRGLRRTASAARAGDPRRRTVIDTERALMVHRRGQPLQLSRSRPTRSADLPGEPEPEAPGYVRVPGTPSTPGSRKGAGSSTTRRTRITAWTAARRLADCGSPSRAPRWSTPPTPSIVFETALEPRLYVDPSLVRTDLLRRSDTSSYCNYKGYATYWSAVIGDTVVDDVAWSYEDPLPETLPIKGYLELRRRRAPTVLAELPSGCDARHTTAVDLGLLRLRHRRLRLRTFSLLRHTFVHVLTSEGKSSGPLHRQRPGHRVQPVRGAAISATFSTRAATATSTSTPRARCSTRSRAWRRGRSPNRSPTPTAIRRCSIRNAHTITRARRTGQVGAGGQGRRVVAHRHRRGDRRGGRARAADMGDQRDAVVRQPVGRFLVGPRSRHGQRALRRRQRAAEALGGNGCWSAAGRRPWC